jgi:hypothetical protein
MTNTPGLILYQSCRTSVCAVLAVGNLLNLYSIPCSRDPALWLFQSGKYKKAITHPLLLKVLHAHFPQQHLRWNRHASFSFDRVRDALEPCIKDKAPALLTINIRHKTRRWFGRHCVVAVAVDTGGIHVIDSLGRRDGRRPNATIAPDESVLGWRVKGTPLIVTPQPVHILCGLPPIP